MYLVKAMAEVQDTLTVMAGIQARQAHVQKLQAGQLDMVRTMLIDGFKLHEQRIVKFDEKMLEIELDAMIRYVDGMRPPPVN
jgi:hypothetical protein